MNTKTPIIRTFLGLVAVAILPAICPAASFTAGSIVIYRVGSGTGSLVNTGNPVFVDEYNPTTGALIQSIALPTAASSSVNPLIASGTASSEGFATLSSDGHYLVLPGYAAALGGSTNLTGTTSSAVKRIVARIDASGNVDTTTLLSDAASGSNPRGAISTDGTQLWISGGAGSVRAATLGGTTSTQLTTAPANVRAIGIFGSQLYASSGSSPFVGVLTVGGGLPTTSGQTSTLLSLTGPTSPYGFYLADLSTTEPGLDTLYIADDAAAGGLYKFSLVSGTWNARGKVGGASEAWRGLTGSSSGGIVTLYATRKGGTAASGGGELVKVVDSTGYNADFSATTATLLATASANTAFRGIAFSPAGAASGGSTNPSATGASSPDPILAGNAITLSAVATSGTNPTDNNLSETCNLSTIGGGTSVALPVVYTIPANTTPGAKSLTCTVSDQQPRSATFSIGFTVSAPPPTTRLIYEINGSGTTSPLAGTQVLTRGVVTAVRGTTGSTRGFYLESAAADRDADPASSEGLLVFVGSASLPACAVVGNNVQIQGSVQDFVPPTAPVGSVPLTELSSTSGCTVLGTPGVASLPAPVTIDGTNIVPGGSATQARKFLGMRVTMSNVTVVGPSTGNLNESTAQATVANNFWVSATGVSRPFHNTPGIQATRRPSDAAVTVPSWNGNPEAIEIDSTGLTDGAVYELGVGSTISSLSGVVDYDTSGGQYQIYSNAAGIGTITSSNLAATPLPTPLASDLLIVDANIERFYNTISNGGDVVLTADAYAGRLNKLSLAVRNVMRMPDILALEEVEGPTSGNAFPVLQDIVNKINGDASSNGQGSPNYAFCGGVTNDVGKIALAVIYRQDHVTQLECSQYGITTQYTLPYTTSPTTNTLNDRPPVVFRGRATAAGSDSGLDVRVVVNHLRSLNGIDEPGTANGDRVRTKRSEQAKYLANLLAGNLGSEQNVNWNLTDNLFVAGDMNAFDVSDGYADSVNCIAGNPAPVNQIYTTTAQNNASSPCTAVPTLSLTNLTTADVAQRYSYSFAGIAQRIDQVLVNARLSPRVRQVSYVRNNADFPEGPTYRNDFNRPERYSDHDAPAVYLKLPMEVTSRSRVNASALLQNRATGRYNGTITVTNTGATALTGPVYVFFYDLPSGVTLPDLPQANGVPYATINLPSGRAPGATSGTAAISFANPTNARIGYTTKRFDINY